MICPNCGGLGVLYPERVVFPVPLLENCPVCEGTGRLKDPEETKEEEEEEQIKKSDYKSPFSDDFYFGM